MSDSNTVHGCRTSGRLPLCNTVVIVLTKDTKLPCLPSYLGKRGQWVWGYGQDHDGRESNFCYRKWEAWEAIVFLDTNPKKPKLFNNQTSNNNQFLFSSFRTNQGVVYIYIFKKQRNSAAVLPDAAGLAAIPERREGQGGRREAVREHRHDGMRGHSSMRGPCVALTCSMRIALK